MTTISPTTFEYPGAEERAAQSIADARAWLDSHASFNAAEAFAPATPVIRPASSYWMTDVEQTQFDASWYAQ